LLGLLVIQIAIAIGIDLPLVHPVNIQLLVSNRHIQSIPIAIPISIVCPNVKDLPRLRLARSVRQHDP